MSNSTCDPNLAAGIEGFFQEDFTFNVLNECQCQGINLLDACSIHFFDNGTVQAYGNITFGNFPANPDIAGEGLWWSQILGALLCIVAGAFLLRELTRRNATLQDRLKNRIKVFRQPSEEVQGLWGWIKRCLHTLIISTADAQILTSMAYGINFAEEGKCTLSAYHYSVGVHYVLSSLAIATLSMVMVRDYWKTPVSAALRIAATLLVFIVLGRMLTYQYLRKVAPEYMYTYRANASDGSALFLPIACFLEPDLNPFVNLTRTEKATVGGQSNPKTTPEYYLYSFLCICYSLAVIAQFVRWMKSRRQRSKTVQPRARDCIITYWLFGLIVPTFVYGWSWGHNYIIRTWVYSSGWMGAGNEEQDVNGLGQVIALALLAGVVIQVMDKARVGHKGGQARSPGKNGHANSNHAP